MFASGSARKVLGWNACAAQAVPMQCMHIVQHAHRVLTAHRAEKRPPGNPAAAPELHTDVAARRREVLRLLNAGRNAPPRIMLRGAPSFAAAVAVAVAADDAGAARGCSPSPPAAGPSPHLSSRWLKEAVPEPPPERRPWLSGASCRAPNAAAPSS